MIFSAFGRRKRNPHRSLALSPQAAAREGSAPRTGPLQVLFVQSFKASPARGTPGGSARSPHRPLPPQRLPGPGAARPAPRPASGQRAARSRASRPSPQECGRNRLPHHPRPHPRPRTCRSPPRLGPRSPPAAGRRAWRVLGPACRGRRRQTAPGTGPAG